MKTLIAVLGNFASARVGDGQKETILGCSAAIAMRPHGGELLRTVAASFL
jgi:hypothetical protein